MTLPLENVATFRERFEEVVAQTITDDQLVPSLNVDLEIEFNQLTKNLLTAVDRMAPFGPDNMKPVFVSHNIHDTGKSKRVGDGTHLRLEVYQKGDRQRHFVGIAFGMGDMITELEKGRSFSLAYTLEENVYRGVSNLQLMVRDIRFND